MTADPPATSSNVSHLILVFIGKAIVGAGQWMLDNPVEASALLAALVGYIGENIRKRPPPDPPTGWRMKLWQAREWFMVMDWDKQFGRFHLPFRINAMLRTLRAGSTPETTVVAITPAQKPPAVLSPPLPPAPGSVAPDGTLEPTTVAAQERATERQVPATTLSALAGVQDITATLPVTPSARRASSPGLPRPSALPPGLPIVPVAPPPSPAPTRPVRPLSERGPLPPRPGTMRGGQPPR